MKAFLGKEWMEMVRTGRGILLLLIFVLFGIMNPAIAKLTPWLMEQMAGSIEASGFLVTETTVDAMVSWTQFFKNMPMALAAFVLLCSGMFTGEYLSGTLIPVVTKGLPRRNIVAAKAMMLTAGWSILYLVCYGITFAYNAYFWDNGIASHLICAAACWWLFGIWVIAFLVLFSAAARTTAQVLAGTGGIVIAAYVLGMFPKLGAVLPIKLMDGMALLQGAASPVEFAESAAWAGVSIVLCMVLAVACFERKRL